MSNYKKIILYDVIPIILTVIASVLLFKVFFPIIIVSGFSMYPTYSDGDVVILQGTFIEPKKGDVIVCTDKNNTILIKRVIATAGDVVNIDFFSGIVYVNGSALDEPYINEYTKTKGNIEFPLTVEEDALFVLGDNRNASRDSRSDTVGNVKLRQVKGIVIGQLFKSHATPLVS